MSEVTSFIFSLERRELVQRSEFAPVDLLHLTGLFQAWDKEAADRGSRLLYDRWALRPGWTTAN